MQAPTPEQAPDTTAIQPLPPESPPESLSERRKPGPGRVIIAVALALLALIVLWAAVSYGTSNQAAAPASGGTTLADDVPSTIASSVAAPLAPVSSPAAAGAPKTGAATVSASEAGATTVGAAKTGATKTGAAKTGATAVGAATTSAATAKPAATFTPVVVQAESSANTLSGGAAVTDCATCDGGARVRYLGRVTVHLEVTVAGTRSVTAEYEADGDRVLELSVNGGTAVSAAASGTDWTTPHTHTFTVPVPSGSVDLAFYCAEGGSPPDLDKITIK
jgi:hypothetical protein